MMRDIQLDTFKSLNFEGRKHSYMIVIYYNTFDYPNKYVGRLFINGKATHLMMVDDTLHTIYCEIPEFMVKIMRDDNDDPVIVESWL